MRSLVLVVVRVARSGRIFRRWVSKASVMVGVMVE